MSWEVTSSYASLLSRGSSFKMKNMNLMSNLNIRTEKFHSIRNSHSSEDLIDAVSSSVLQILTDVGRYLTESNNLFIRCVVEVESKKENWKEIPKKKKTKTTPETILNKVQATDNRHNETALSCKDKPERDRKRLHSANKKSGKQENSLHLHIQ